MRAYRSDVGRLSERTCARRDHSAEENRWCPGPHLTQSPQKPGVVLTTPSQDSGLFELV
ncbi:unnamed protein product [Periconia digitata]|uniref:Uncharacterized protein n=1 Tax=Periconia digitata TaxID=1303443 RepID=A0A9W4U317_9PLEO|nr:unnamed protein product [Periconia digitata]